MFICNRHNLRSSGVYVISIVLYRQTSLNMASTVEGFRYKDKVTIVTGGAQGIGRACVEVFGKVLVIYKVLLSRFC